MNIKMKKIVGYSIILICLLTVFLPFLVSCSGEDSTPIAKETIFNLLFPNVWVFVAMILASTILITVIIWLVWTPFNKKMDDRKKAIQKELVDAENAKLDALKNQKKSEEDLINTQTQINSMITNATIKANAIQEEIRHNATEQANIILKNAQSNIELEKQIMCENMENEILDVAFDAVTEISRQKITREENDKLVKDFIANFDKVNENDK